MIKIWGRGSSLNVQKVIWLCEEIALDYETIKVGGSFGGLDQPEFRALNPNGLIPVVETDDTVIWESNAILRHLASRHGDTSLWSRDASQRARTDMWLDWQLTTLWPPVRTMFLQLVRTAEEERNRALLAREVSAATRAVEMLNGVLQLSDYVAGDQFSLADIALGVVAYRWFELPFDRPALQAAEAWYKRLQERDAFRQVVMLPLS